MRISDWSSDVCSSDLEQRAIAGLRQNTDGERQTDNPQHATQRRSNRLQNGSLPIRSPIAGMVAENSHPTLQQGVANDYYTDDKKYIQHVLPPAFPTCLDRKGIGWGKSGSGSGKP